MKIKTKFDIGQEVYYIDKNSMEIYQCFIEGIQILRIGIMYYIYDDYYLAEKVYEENLFATRKEAEAKLKELE